MPLPRGRNCGGELTDKEGGFEMLPGFSPQRLDFRAAVNSVGPTPQDLDLANPLILPVFLAGIRFDPAAADMVVNIAVSSPGPFSVRDALVFDEEMVTIRDPDTHTTVRVKALVFAASRSGPG